MSLANIEDTLTMSEMEEIMAGSGCMRKQLGCAIAAFTMGLVTGPWGGVITGFVCNRYAFVSDCDVL